MKIVASAGTRWRKLKAAAERLAIDRARRRLAGFDRVGTHSPNDEISVTNHDITQSITMSYGVIDASTRHADGSSER